MSFRMVNWAYEQDLPPSPKFLLVTLADKADDDGTTAAGVDFLAYETGISTRTVLRHLKQLEEMDLLHKERREYKGFGGRKTNLTILHPWVAGTKPKWHDYKKLQREAEKTRREFGVTEPVENFEPVQGDNLALSSDSGADAQRDNLSPSAHKVTSVHTQGDKSCNFGSVALKGTRARLNHQLINHQSVSQSVKSPEAVENSGPTDGRTRNENLNLPQTEPAAAASEVFGSSGSQGVERPVDAPPAQQPMQGNSTSVTAEAVPVQVQSQQRQVPPQGSFGSTVPSSGSVVSARDDSGPMVQGVALRQLASDLVSDGVPVAAVQAVATCGGLSRMVEVAMSRSQQVRSPQRYCRVVLAREWDALVSQCASNAYPVCRQHRCRLSPAGECKRCVSDQRAAELDELHHELVWKRHLDQVDVATLEISLRRAGYAIDSVSVQDFGQHIMAALNSGVAPTNNDLFRFFADNAEIFTHTNAASNKVFAGFGHERTA